jgi:hypothetical protein
MTETESFPQQHQVNNNALKEHSPKKRSRSRSKKQRDQQQQRRRHPPQPSEQPQQGQRKEDHDVARRSQHHFHATPPNRPQYAVLKDSGVFTTPKHASSHDHHRDHQVQSTARRDEHQATNHASEEQNTLTKTVAKDYEKDNDTTTSTVLLWWYSPNPLVPVQAEEQMRRVLLRWGAKEFGMVKDQPAFRLEQIQQACRRHNNMMTLSQALSLRRHLMKQFHPLSSMQQLRLGSDVDIRKSAQLFEQAVALYLEKCQVRYQTEEEQRKEFPPPPLEEEGANSMTTTLRLPTPDFRFHPPVTIIKYDRKRQHDHRHDHRGQDHQHQHHQQNDDRMELERRTVHWMEAKMFYGASIIPHDNKSAVGCVLSTAKKYVQAYGQGAFIFMYGCGTKLAEELAQVGVMVLDCSGDNSQGVDVSPVERHQRQWCGNRDGMILP